MTEKKQPPSPAAAQEMRMRCAEAAAVALQSSTQESSGLVASNVMGLAKAMYEFVRTGVAP